MVLSPASIWFNIVTCHSECAISMGLNVCRQSMGIKGIEHLRTTGDEMKDCPSTLTMTMTGFGNPHMLARID